ncbi:hypothetical protein [Wenyingzhuangia fucanilytica]|nr:hypothetical protein [Wenyingzhuangia fucanilytica]
MKKTKFIYTLSIFLILLFSCKSEKKVNAESNNISKTEIKNIKKNKPKVFSINERTITLNNYSLSESFNVEKLIIQLGEPEIIEQNSNNISETGYPDYYIKISENQIYSSYGETTEVYLKNDIFSILGLRIGNKREKVEKKFNIQTFNFMYIQLVNDIEESIFIKFNSENEIISLNYYQMIL